MLRLITRRAVLAAALVAVVSALTYILLSLAPGDPAATILGPYATQQQIAQLRTEMGLNLPIWTQYWHWLSQAVRGNLGSSLISSQSVLSELESGLYVTLSLVAGATLVSLIGGIAVGTVSAIRGGAAGRFLDSLAMLGFAIPNFWLGLILVDLIAIKAHLLPATGYAAFSASPVRWFESLILPVLTLAIGGVTGIAKQTRDSMRTELSRDYIDALRAAGVPERRIIWRHALKNAAIPILTLSGVFFVGMLGGAAIIENVFAMPGLGSMAVTATNEGDLPTVLGVAIVFCLIVVAVNLLIDLAYGWVNPKARVA